jgi:hypothetical protein
MNLLESQDILLGVLKIYGLFPFNFGGKFRKLKGHLYNFLVSFVLILTFSTVRISQLNLALVNTTEKDSVLGFLTVIMEDLSTIVCFAIIKLYLLVKSDVQEKYFEALRDLEATVRSHHIRNTKIDQIIEELRKSTLRQEIFFITFVVFMEFSYDYFSANGNILMYIFWGTLSEIVNCFFLQILIFLKINMNIVRRLQNHINKVLLNLQKLDRHFDVEDFIKIHRKVKQCLEALNEAFGLIFLLTLVEIYGSMIPQIYKSVLTLGLSNSKISLNLLVYIILNFIWVLFNYFYLGQFALECDKMDEEVNFNNIPSIGVALHKVGRNCTELKL